MWNGGALSSSTTEGKTVRALDDGTEREHRERRRIINVQHVIVMTPDVSRSSVMVQTVATMLSLILAGGAGLVIAWSLIEDWAALRHALGAAPALPVLPARTRRVMGARRARFVRITLESSATRAAA